ncbi:FtsX-like permease family protein [Tessaracoccus terricola]
MWKASLHTLRTRLWQVLMCLCAIIISVAALSAALSLNALVRTTTEGVVAATAADVTVVPAGSLVAVDAVSAPPPLSATTVADVAEIPGVTRARGQVRGDVLFPITSDGELLQPQLAPTITGSFLPTDDEGGAHIAISDGRAPEGPDEVVLDRPTLERSGFEIGDTVAFARTGPHPSIEAVVVGVVALEGDRPAGASYALFSEAAARTHFQAGKDGFNSIWVDLDDGPDVDVDAIISEMRDLIPSEYQIVDGGQVASATQFQLYPRLTIAQVGLWAAGLVTLGIAAALISTTTSHLVTRRRPEAAFLRRLGASPVKVALPILVEALLLGLVGSAIGMPIGQSLADRLNDLGREHGLALGAVIPDLSTTEAWLCIGLGVLITVLAAHRHATAVSFTEALPPRPFIPRPRLHFSDAAWTSVGLVAVGVGLLAVGTVLPGMPLPWAWALLGAVVVLVGTAIATPVLGAPFVRLVGLAGRPLLRDVSTIAARNVTRHPVRFAKATAALVLGVGLVATFAVLGASGRASAQHDLPENIHGDLFVTSSAEGGFNRGVGELAATLPGVEQVTTYGIQTALRGGDPVRFAVAMPGTLTDVVNYEVTDGRELEAVDEIMVSAEYAAATDLERGNAFNVVINQQRVEVRVVGIFEPARGVDLPPVISARGTFTDRGVTDVDDFVALELARTADVGTLRTILLDITSSDPLLRVQDIDELAAARGEALAAASDTVGSLLTLLTWIAIIGIAGTLLIAVQERKPEFGALRLVGMDRLQVSAMVALEAILMGTVGGLVGTAAGTIAGWGLQRGLANMGYPFLEIPWDSLWGLVLRGFLVGVAAAVLPLLAALKLQGPYRLLQHRSTTADVAEPTVDAV